VVVAISMNFLPDKSNNKSKWGTYWGARKVNFRYTLVFQG